MDCFEEIMLLPCLENHSRALLTGYSAEFRAGILLLDRMLEVAFDGKVKPFLGPRFELESHSGCVAQHAKQAHGLIREAVNCQSANFASFYIRKPVCGVKE